VTIMPTYVEVWPVAADQLGIWLTSGTDAWEAGPVPADSEPYLVVRGLLQGHGQDNRCQLLHSTSWRTEHGPGGSRNVLTYVAVLGPVYADGDDALALDVWPDAQPLHLKLHRHAGDPAPHAPADRPVPRKVDVLLHAVRHLKFLAETDAGGRAVLGYGWWPEHLATWTPTLAGLYRQTLLGG
jgi:hypothetical protein